MTVSAVPDHVDNPNNRTTEITHSTSGDSKYSDENNDSTEPELLVTVEDDADTAALIISETAITVTEDPAGEEATYTVRLNSAPPAGPDVTVTLSLSGDAGLIEVAPSISTPLSFTGGRNGDWDQPKPVTVTSTKDNFDTPGDGRVTIEHTVSGQGGYDNVAPVDVRVTVRDDDVSELQLSPTAVSVNENGGTASYTVRLRRDPGTDNTVSVAIRPDPDSDAGAIGNQDH